MDPTKLAAVRDWAPLTSVKAVQLFIGSCNFYRKFIPNFSILTRPLHDLTKKGVAFRWGLAQDKTFIKLKEIFISAPVLHMPDILQPFHVMTNTSLTATGGVLMWVDSNGDLHPCAYHSQTLSMVE